jgi:hypothetical protein
MVHGLVRYVCQGGTITRTKWPVDSWTSCDYSTCSTLLPLRKSNPHLGDDWYTLKTEISELIRNSDMNDRHNTESYRDVWIIVGVLY